MSISANNSVLYFGFVSIIRSNGVIEVPSNKVTFRGYQDMSITSTTHYVSVIEVTYDHVSRQHHLYIPTENSDVFKDIDMCINIMMTDFIKEKILAAYEVLVRQLGMYTLDNLSWLIKKGGTTLNIDKCNVECSVIDDSVIMTVDTDKCRFTKAFTIGEFLFSILVYDVKGIMQDILNQLNLQNADKLKYMDNCREFGKAKHDNVMPIHRNADGTWIN